MSRLHPEQPRSEAEGWESGHGEVRQAVWEGSLRGRIKMMGSGAGRSPAGRPAPAAESTAGGTPQKSKSRLSGAELAERAAAALGADAESAEGEAGEEGEGGAHHALVGQLRRRLRRADQVR